MSTAQRHSRNDRAPTVRATALVLAALLIGGGQTTQAAPRPPLDDEAKAAKAAKAAAKDKVMVAAKEEATKAAAAAQAAANVPIPVLEGGKVVGQKTPDEARKAGLTVVDLSDDWLPYVFSETPEKPQPLRPFLLNLANGRYGTGRMYARPHEDRFFEVFGIFPSLNLVRRRLADKKRRSEQKRDRRAEID